MTNTTIPDPLAQKIILRSVKQVLIPGLVKQKKINKGIAETKAKRELMAKKSKSSNGDYGPASEYSGRDKKKWHSKDIIKYQPKTPNQTYLDKKFKVDDMNFFLYGSAGTGKTFYSMYKALQLVLDPESPYDDLIIVRSVVPAREVGYLPGSLDEKVQVYEEPYASICDELFEYSNAYDNLKTAGYITFMPTSFMRGSTYNNAIILVDETQNMTFQELDTVITRVGRDSKIIFCGDRKQSDLIYKKNDISGFDDFLKIIEQMNRFEVIEFTREDIVRSDFVKSYIIAKENVLE